MGNMSVVDKVKEYAGKSMDAWMNPDKRKPTNPHITAREAIELADYIVKLESKISELQYEIHSMKGHKYL